MDLTPVIGTLLALLLIGLTLFMRMLVWIKAQIVKLGVIGCMKLVTFGWLCLLVIPYLVFKITVYIGKLLFVLLVWPFLGFVWQWYSTIPIMLCLTIVWGILGLQLLGMVFNYRPDLVLVLDFIFPHGWRLWHRVIVRILRWGYRSLRQAINEIMNE